MYVYCHTGIWLGQHYNALYGTFVFCVRFTFSISHKYKSHFLKFSLLVYYQFLHIHADVDACGCQKTWLAPRSQKMWFTLKTTQERTSSADTLPRCTCPKRNACCWWSAPSATIKLIFVVLWCDLRCGVIAKMRPGGRIWISHTRQETGRQRVY